MKSCILIRLIDYIILHFFVCFNYTFFVIFYNSNPISFCIQHPTKFLTSTDERVFYTRCIRWHTILAIKLFDDSIKWTPMIYLKTTLIYSRVNARKYKACNTMVALISSSGTNAYRSMQATCTFVLLIINNQVFTGRRWILWVLIYSWHRLYFQC